MCVTSRRAVHEQYLKIQDISFSCNCHVYTQQSSKLRDSIDPVTHEFSTRKLENVYSTSHSVGHLLSSRSKEWKQWIRMLLAYLLGLCRGPKKSFCLLIYSMKQLLLFDSPELKIIRSMLSVLNQIYVFLFLPLCSLHRPRSLTKYFFQLFHPILFSLTLLPLVFKRETFFLFQTTRHSNTVRLEKDFLDLNSLGFLREALSLVFGLCK